MKELINKPVKKTLEELLKEASEIKKAIFKEATENEGEVSDDLINIESITFEELQSKVDGYALLIQSLKAESETLESQIKDYERVLIKPLKDKMESTESRKKRILERVNSLMTFYNYKELDGSNYQLKVVGNGGKQKMVITDSKDVEQDYIKNVPTIDNEKIRKALEEGTKLSFAYLEERGTRVDVKIK